MCREDVAERRLPAKEKKSGMRSLKTEIAPWRKMCLGAVTWAGPKFAEVRK
jgi:hypothetical protein